MKNNICEIYLIVFIIIFIGIISVIKNKLQEPALYDETMDVKIISIDVYIYSSFYYLKSNTIEILGYSNNNNSLNLICTVIYNNNDKKVCNITYKIYKTINKNFLAMKIQILSGMQAKYVYINNILITTTVIHEQFEKYYCTLCITKFINYTAATYLLEAINSYKIIGIDHIVIYYMSSSPYVLQILKHYQREGYIDIIKWNYKHEIEYLKKYVYGQIWKYNDCFYRYKSNSHTLLFNDIDEVLWNNNYTTIKTVIYNLNLNQYDVIYLHNRIFKKEFFSNNNYTNSRLIPYDRFNHYIPDFSMFSYHNSCTYKERYLCKYIINNYSKIKYIGIHDILVYSGAIKMKYIDKNVVFLRHTRRIREDLLKDCNKWNNYFSYKEEYISSVVKKQKHLLNIP